jgi:hypothetical protein
MMGGDGCKKKVQMSRTAILSNHSQVGYTLYLKLKLMQIYCFNSSVWANIALPTKSTK